MLQFDHNFGIRETYTGTVPGKLELTVARLSNHWVSAMDRGSTKYCVLETKLCLESLPPGLGIGLLCKCGVGETSTNNYQCPNNLESFKSEAHQRFGTGLIHLQNSWSNHNHSSESCWKNLSSTQNMTFLAKNEQNKKWGRTLISLDFSFTRASKCDFWR